MKESMPIPRIQGQAFELVDKTWGWEIRITIGQEGPLFMSYPKEDQKGFSTRDEALDNLRKTSQEVGELICKEAYGVKPDGFLNLKKNVIEKNVTI